jgi:putative hydrolase of the HAD superfamily
MKHIKQIIFDADDTLWANNIYYVKATNDFINLTEEIGFDRQQVQADFDRLEIQVVQDRGYGSKNFVYILEQLLKKYQTLNGKRLNPQKFNAIIDQFSEHPRSKPAIFKNVLSTLRDLMSRYDLYILTKGEQAEQKNKIINAGMHQLVKTFFIVSEKNDQVYRYLLMENHWQAAETCMVGNSPKSDINPALRCGMYAVYIPYSDTWKLDVEPIEDFKHRFIEIKQFADLRQIFLNQISG